MYDTEEELKELLGTEEYLDLIFKNGNSGWELDWDEDNESQELVVSLAMEVYVKRKAEGLTQRELARKLGIGLETLSKIEKGHENLSSKVKIKIFDFLNNEDAH